MFTFWEVKYWKKLLIKKKSIGRSSVLRWEGVVCGEFWMITKLDDGREEAGASVWGRVLYLDVQNFKFF